MEKCYCIDSNDSCSICEEDVEYEGHERMGDRTWYISGWCSGSNTYTFTNVHWNRVSWLGTEEINMCDDSGTAYFDFVARPEETRPEETRPEEPQAEEPQAEGNEACDFRRSLQIDLLPRIESAVRELRGDLDYNKVGEAKSTLKEAIEVIKKMID